MEPQVVLVDDMDREVGVMGKLEAHEKALLHRAFSVIIINSKNEILLQQRAKDKYHAPGLWSNSCCSHPQPDETIPEAITRRCVEELGLKIKRLSKITHLHYKHAFDNGLTEHEFDHIYLAMADSDIKINEKEVHAVDFISVHDLYENVGMHPEKFTPWFLLILAMPEVQDLLKTMEVEEKTI